MKLLIALLISVFQLISCRPQNSDSETQSLCTDTPKFRLESVFFFIFRLNLPEGYLVLISDYGTCKSLSEALLFSEHGENMLCTKIVLNVRNNYCTQHILPRFELGIFMYWTCNSMNNLSSYCGLVDAKIRASDKDLPVAEKYS